MSFYNAVICRYGELGLKGKNRNKFEDCFVNNIRYLLKNVDNLKIYKIRGRVWIQHEEKNLFSDEEMCEIRKRLPHLFGLETFSPVIMCEPEIDALEKIVSDTSHGMLDTLLEKYKNPSFCVRVRRSDKRFPLTSKEMEIKLAFVVGEHPKRDDFKVDLENADMTIGCEIRTEFAFIYYEIISGPGGLPVGSNSPILSLISGGIDSPVASYLAMKRGCAVEFLTFHSDPYTPQESVDKVLDLVKVLNDIQKPQRLHLCNLAPFQKLVRDNCNERFRTVLYRRAMMRIAEKVAKQRKKLALLTGEAIGQVASQTIANMSVIDKSCDMLILRPLLGTDKKDIIEFARKIGTFEISKLQVPDSCTVFAPSSPATAAKLGKVESEELLIPNYEEELDKAIENMKTIRYQ